MNVLPVPDVVMALFPQRALSLVLRGCAASLCTLLSLSVQAKPQLAQQFQGHDLKGESIAQITCSDRSMQFATVTSDGTAKVWNGNGTLVQRYQPTLPAMLFNGRFVGLADSGLAVAAYNGYTSIWGADPSQPPRMLGPSLSGTTDVQPLADQGALVTGSDDGFIRFWSDQGQLLKRISGPGVTRHLAYSKTLKLIAATQDIGTVMLFSPQGAVLKTLKTAQGRLNDVVFSPTQPLLLSGGFDGTIKVWRLADGGRQVSLLRTIPAPAKAGWLEGLAINADGVVAAAYDDGVLRVWNLKGQSLGQIKLADDVHLFSACFAPDQRTVRTIAQDGTVSVVELPGPGH